MIKFFRRIRQRLLSENKFSKYMLYAVGEIVLVVIGILIALQINNWNEERLQQRTLSNYYKGIYEELKSVRPSIVSFSDSIQNLADQNIRTLKILRSNSKDSLPLLRETLGALGTAWTNNFNFPIVEEFINEGYLAEINNMQIKKELQAFSIQLAKFSNLDRAISNQYVTTIEPFINKNLNYSEIALGRYKEDFVPGGPPTEFNGLHDNMEAWNVITLKLELLASQRRRLDVFVALIDRLTDNLNTELNLGLND